MAAAFGDTTAQNFLMDRATGHAGDVRCCDPFTESRRSATGQLSPKGSGSFAPISDI